MQVNYQIYDNDFTCATPIFQKFRWGISCCGTTMPGEMKVLVVRTTVWSCTSVVPSLPTAAPGGAGNALRLPAQGEAAPFCSISPFHSWLQAPTKPPGWWRQQWHEQNQLWLGTSTAKDKVAAVALKPELSWCPSPGELLQREALRQRRRFQEYTGVSRVETRRSGTTLVSVIKMQSGGKGRSWPRARLSRDTTVRPPTRSVHWKLSWTKAWEIWTQMPIRLALLCSSGAQRSSNMFCFQHQWALQKREVSKLRGHFIHVLEGDATSERRSRMHRGGLNTASADRYQCGTGWELDLVRFHGRGRITLTFRRTITECVCKWVCRCDSGQGFSFQRLHNFYHFNLSVSFAACLNILLLAVLKSSSFWFVSVNTESRP